MKDYMVRAISANKEVRAFAVSARDTVEEMRSRHNTSPVVTAALGRLLLGGAMMGSMLQDDDLLTLSIRCNGPVEGLTVTADSDGHVKGFALEPEVINPVRKTDNKLDVRGIVGQGLLKVIKDQGLKAPYVGEIQLVNGEIAEDLTFYFAQSEQTPSAVGLGILMNKENTVREAGGFIVQLLPGASEESISALERNVAKISSVTDLLVDGNTPEDIIGILLQGLDPEILSQTPVSFRCNCGTEKIEKVLISLGKEELESLIAENKETEVKCQFCGKAYKFSVDELKLILASLN
ncbi:MAG: Hsp33 family molecular chaperone HslO [Lachnospiraceae bacterium]|nr:Hsp33 family molecular chaperone HslO [Lachnospiraceae bacterium]